MDLDLERSDLETTGRGGATTKVWDVGYATEEVDLATTDPLGGDGFETETVPTQAILVYDDPPESDATSPDGVYPNSRIAAAEAGEREVLTVTLSTGGRRQTVDRVLSLEVSYGVDEEDGDDDAEDGEATALGSRRRKTRTAVRLDDSSEWNLGGRPATVEAEPVRRITGG